MGTTDELTVVGPSYHVHQPDRSSGSRSDAYRILYSCHFTNDAEWCWCSKGQPTERSRIVLCGPPYLQKSGLPPRGLGDILFVFNHKQASVPACCLVFTYATEL